VHRRLLTTTVLAACALTATASAWSAPGPKPGPQPPPSGTLAICNVSGVRPITIALGYTAAAPASAGGTQTYTVGVGACTTQVFFTQGVSLTVTENVPSGYSVTAISIAGGASAITSSNLAAGSATVTIGSGQSILTFTTNGPALFTPPRACKVPNVLGLGLTAARTALKKGACTLGRVTKTYSRAFPVGRVSSAKPKRGTILAHAAPVDLVLSRGPRP
jgi:hypothetical protein